MAQAGREPTWPCAAPRRLVTSLAIRTRGRGDEIGLTGIGRDCVKTLSGAFVRRIFSHVGSIS